MWLTAMDTGWVMRVEWDGILGREISFGTIYRRLFTAMILSRRTLVRRFDLERWAKISEANRLVVPLGPSRNEIARVLADVNSAGLWLARDVS